MLTLEVLSDSPKQSQTVILPDGSQVSFTLEYKPLQMGWYITDFTYGTFELHGIRVVTSPNFLRQFRNALGFGMACFTQDTQEPTLEDDFTQGRSSLFILTSDEVQEYEEYLSGVSS